MHTQCHTCQKPFKPQDLILEQHEVIVCATADCCWRNYVPPEKYRNFTRKRGNQQSEPYRLYIERKHKYIHETHLKAVRASLEGLTMMERIKLLFGRPF